MLKRKSGKAWSLKLSLGQEKEAQRLAGTITVKDETFCTQVTMKSCVAASLAQAVPMGFSLMDFTRCAIAHLRRRTATFTYLPCCKGYDLSKNLYACNQLSKFLNFCSFEELQPVRVTRPQEKTQPRM
ncbi:MAG: hypothetical protein WCL90_10370 [Planctomycetota bacterium]|jgi:hypothetical protein